MKLFVNGTHKIRDYCTLTVLVEAMQKIKHVNYYIYKGRAVAAKPNTVKKCIFLLVANGIISINYENDIFRATFDLAMSSR